MGSLDHDQAENTQALYFCIVLSLSLIYCSDKKVGRRTHETQFQISMALCDLYII